MASGLWWIAMMLTRVSTLLPFLSSSTTSDLHHRDAAYRLYRLLWGRHTPNCATPSHSTEATRLHQYFSARQHASKEERTWQRIARAREYLRVLRAPREFPVPTAGGGGGGRGQKKQKKGHVQQQQAVYTAQDLEELPMEY